MIYSCSTAYFGNCIHALYVQQRPPRIETELSDYNLLDFRSTRYSVKPDYSKCRLISARDYLWIVTMTTIYQTKILPKSSAKRGSVFDAYLLRGSNRDNFNKNNCLFGPIRISCFWELLQTKSESPLIIKQLDNCNLKLTLHYLALVKFWFLLENIFLDQYAPREKIEESNRLEKITKLQTSLRNSTWSNHRAMFKEAFYCLNLSCQLSPRKQLERIYNLIFQILKSFFEHRPTTISRYINLYFITFAISFSNSLVS